MMDKLYRLAVGAYFGSIRLAALFNPKARLFVSGRKNLFEKLRHHLPQGAGPLFWFHAASLGEFEQGRPVIEALKKLAPNARVLLTFFSPSGYEVRKGYAGADYVCYLPAESKRNVQKFLDLVKPDVAVFIKYEFWKTYIEEIKRRQITLISISTIFRSSQFLFSPYAGFLRNSLQLFDHFFVQNEESANLLRNIGVRQITIAGDTRFDRVKEIRQQAKAIDAAERFKNGKYLMVMGSVWPDDMDVFFPVMEALQHKLKFIIAPHQIEDTFIKTIEAKFTGSAVRFSQTEGKHLEDFQILLIDNIGMLSSLYGYGDMAYVGGGFHGALHNTLEPATFGIPVVWGDHAKNVKFQEVKGLLAAGAGFAVRSSAELQGLLDGFLENDGLRKAKGAAAGSFVASNTGATALIVDFLMTKLEKK